ncbi:AN1-type zinc finger protein 2A [Bradysia coprophila]|uniref:AN1-type zinc finger protein 2A n=1 Tax=Bradysia coprophila TaxID=38358 RepID=UPI00187DA774|nr:AN1-type zinc finger protein 2A [Bradysia coprophila]
MEFPHLGKHCSQKSCNKYDFLPMSCDACHMIFCSEHFSYQKHACTSAHKKDFQVPACPLCGEPVPTPRGVSPDMTVGQHIDQYCKSDKRKIFTNKCSFKGCKKKELIPVKCSQCTMNFCLRHRHSSDHDCKNLAAARANRSNSPNLAAKVQGTMTEDEALAHALARSIQELDESHDRTHRRNLQPPNGATVVNGGGDASSSSSKDKCSLS